MPKHTSKEGFSLIESIVMLVLIFVVGVLTVSLLRKDLIGVDTSEPVDTMLHDILKFGDDDDSGITIEGLPPLVEEPLRNQAPPAVPSNSEDDQDTAPSPLEAPPF